MSQNPFKRGNSWTFVYYVKDEHGNRKQRWKGGYATKREAEADLKIYKARADLNEITATTREYQTIASWMQEWLDLRRPSFQPQTANEYRGVMNKHIIPNIGKVKLKDLKPSTLQRFYNQLSSNGLKSRTINYIHTILKSVLNAAIAEGYINENVCTKVKPPKITKFKHGLLTVEQIKFLLRYLEGHKYETEIKLAIYLGLRRGEVLGIKEEDIDYTQHTLAIQRQVGITKYTKITDKTPYHGIKCLKSESSNRVLYLSPEVEELLKRKIIYNHQQKEILREKYNDQGLICCKPNGDIISPHTITRNFHQVLSECGLPDIRFHDLRHTYATLCIDNNVPIKVISQVLGHSSIAITDIVYADSISQRQDLANIISKAVSNDD